MATAPQPNNSNGVDPNVDLELDIQTPSAMIPAGKTLTPIELLQLAILQNANVDQLTKLMDLQERWEKNERRKAYFAAMELFKAEIPRISKNKHVRFDSKKEGTASTDYWHATLDHVCDVLIPALSKHGITHQWVPAQPPGLVRITCILTHVLGHSEQATLEAPPDNSGNKNPVQAVSSTVTMLQRYTFLSAVGAAAKNTDSDGRVLEAENGRVERHCALMISALTPKDLHSYFRNAYGEAAQAQDKAAMDRYIAVKDARKKELAKVSQ
jgi:hypothetical protein